MCASADHGGSKGISARQTQRGYHTMAQVEPFTAIRYTEQDLSALVAPPYDILDEKDKAALLRKDEHNIVAIDLPHMPPKTAGPDAAYQRAAGEMTSWLDIRAIARDEQPAFYVYHQTYKLGKKTLTRKKFFARLRLEEFGKGQIFPHEQTFGGPKEDRLKLTNSTRCNISPIFGLYPDPKNEVSALLDAAIADRGPDQMAMLDGVQNMLWVVTEETVIKQVQRMLDDKPVFIADGHHRYGTAMMYRQLQVDETGEPTKGDPVNFVLAVLGGMEDPGATIAPYFRTIVDVPQVTPDALRAALSDTFDWRPTRRPKDADELAVILKEAGPGAMALYFGAAEVCVTIVPKDEDLLAKLEPKRKPAWRKLPYTVLHRFILDEVITKNLCGGKAPAIHYHKTLSEAASDATVSSGIACLMPATTMQQLRDICTAGELMPQKSTYFFPKLATGMVINPLY